MGRRSRTKATEREGAALIALLLLTFAASMAGWAWLAGLGALAVLGLAAATVGADTRTAGDWRRVDPS